MTNFPETIHMEFSSNKRVLRGAAIVLLFSGVVLILLGAWMKITEQASADMLLVSGLCANVLGIILIVVASPRLRSSTR